MHDGTLLACAEMLRGGITCFNDMYFFPERQRKPRSKPACAPAIGMIALDFPTAYASDADDYLHKGLAMRDQFSRGTAAVVLPRARTPPTLSATKPSARF